MQVVHKDTYLVASVAIMLSDDEGECLVIPPAMLGLLMNCVPRPDPSSPPSPSPPIPSTTTASPSTPDAPGPSTRAASRGKGVKAKGKGGKEAVGPSRSELMSCWSGRRLIVVSSPSIAVLLFATTCKRDLVGQRGSREACRMRSIDRVPVRGRGRVSTAAVEGILGADVCVASEWEE